LFSYKKIYGALLNLKLEIKNGYIFQIEREVILSNVDKNLKIPILNEYKKRPKSVAPDTPNVQIAWSEQSSNAVSLL
jgi:hypothetical protein